MNAIQLTIEHPVTEWCGSCAYEAKRSFNSYSGKCPDCGSTNIYTRLKLEKVFSVRISQGVFFIYLDGRKGEEQYQYHFFNTPMGDISVICDEDHETGCVFQTLESLSYSTTMSSRSLSKIKELYKVVFEDGGDWKAEQEMAIANNRRRELERELYILAKTYGFYGANQ